MSVFVHHSQATTIADILYDTWLVTAVATTNLFYSQQLIDHAFYSLI